MKAQMFCFTRFYLATQNKHDSLIFDDVDRKKHRWVLWRPNNDIYVLLIRRQLTSNQYHATQVYIYHIYVVDAVN